MKPSLITTSHKESKRLYTALYVHPVQLSVWLPYRGNVFPVTLYTEGTRRDRNRWLGSVPLVGCLMLDSFRSRKKSNSSSLFRRRPRKYWRRSVGGGGEAGKGRTPVPDTVMNRSSGGRLMFRPAGDFREIPQTMPQSFRARKLQYQCIKAAPGVLSCQPFRPARCVG